MLLPMRYSVGETITTKVEDEGEATRDAPWRGREVSGPEEREQGANHCAGDSVRKAWQKGATKNERRKAPTVQLDLHDNPLVPAHRSKPAHWANTLSRWEADGAAHGF
jgi:hypothetical protein